MLGSLDTRPERHADGSRKRSSDGEVHIPALLPGKYEAFVACWGNGGLQHLSPAVGFEVVPDVSRAPVEVQLILEKP